ncbi:MAG TPA: hypothetical protein VEV17_17710 [Bryobacteraceae bacterium]|nr:hypothetical protein [Bryobacteraceae bacterium]
MCGIGGALVAHGLNVQPTETVATAQEILALAREHTATLLGFMALDTLFVIGYVTVFAVIFLAIPQQDRLIGGIGLGAGILAGLADMTENALYVVYALGALHGNAELAPSLPFHYYATQVKWMAAFAAVGMQLLVFPRRTALERAIVAVMCTFPLLGAVSIAWPALMPLRALFFVVGLPLLMVYFHQRAAASEAA